MRKLGLLETKPKGLFLPERDQPASQFGRGYVEDDHIPFLVRGVSILHVIPTPFPAFWHTMDDDAAHVDIPTVRDWAKIFSAFTAEWMDIEGDLLPPSSGEEKKREYSDKSEL
jgi:hypothetical protein